MREGTDETLLRAFCAPAGRWERQRCLGELARRYERALLGLAAGLLRGRADLASDAVQETWLRVIRFGQQFAGRSSFKTWLYRIAVNRCAELRRELEAAATDAVVPGALETRDAVSLDREEQRERVRRAVERLGPEQRLVVVLCYHEGLSRAEVAEILEIPVGTVKSRLHAALAELRAMLGAEAES